MKIPGQHLSGHLGSLARRIDTPTSHVSEQNEMLCEAKVLSTNVFLEAHSPFDRERPMRPYLHILGNCTGIRGAFPYGVTELDYSDRPINVDYFYEFTNEELADLAQKGLFDRGFRVPDIMFGNEFYFPAKCNTLIVEPEAEGEPPIIFAEILEAHDLVTCSKECGYDFAHDNFEAIREEDRFDDFIEDDFTPVEVKDAMFDEKSAEEAEIVSVEDVASPEDEEARAKLAREYENIAAKVHRDHVMRSMTQDEVFEANELSEEEEMRFAARMAEHKELEPLPDVEEVEVFESTEVEYRSADVELVPIDETEEPVEDASVEVEASEVFEISDETIDDEEVSKEEPIGFQDPKFVQRSRKDRPIPESLRRAAEELKELEAQEEDASLDINDSI